MSREGMMMPAKKPTPENSSTIRRPGKSISPTSTQTVAVTLKPAEAIRPWREVQPVRMPPTSTPTALMARRPVSAMLATATGVPCSSPSVGTR